MKAVILTQWSSCYIEQQQGPGAGLLTGVSGCEHHNALHGMRVRKTGQGTSRLQLSSAGLCHNKIPQNNAAATAVGDVAMPSNIGSAAQFCFSQCALPQSLGAC